MPPLAKFDGSWRIIRLSEECKKKKVDFIVNITNGVATTQLGKGKASPAGDFTYTAKPADGGIVTLTGKISGTSGSGTALFRRAETGFSCSGTFTMTSSINKKPAGLARRLKTS